MIRVTDAVKTFEGYHALDGLTMNVKKGSVYGLIGPNGAGKTTVLKTIAGVYTADSGSVMIDGEEVFENTNAKQKMFFINDDLYFFSTYSIIEAARFYAEIYPNWSWERFENLKAVFNIDTKRKIRKLSKGMQKQVGFWIAISAMPDVLLLDEPVDGLDPVMRRNVWATVLQDVADRGTTVLVSSHSLRELEEVCDHVGIVHQGKVVLEKALDDVKGHTHKLQLAFDGDVPSELVQKLNPLHTEKFGSVSMMIVRGDGNEIINTVHCYNPLVADILPLTLEEVFIYELGGMGYEFKNVIL